MSRRRTAVLGGLFAAVWAVLAWASPQGNQEALGRVRAGYRHWTHVKSMVIHDPSHPLFGPFGGIHHVYVNPKGAAAVKKGGPYPEGTVFVFDLLEAKEENGAYMEGKRKVLAMMRKDTKTFSSTGGWEFLAFARGDANNQVVKDPGKECFACHATQKKSDYVYSAWRP
jgi:hypothetical protein